MSIEQSSYSALGLTHLLSLCVYSLMCAHSFMYVQPYSALELWVGDVCVGGVYNVARNEERSVSLHPTVLSP